MQGEGHEGVEMPRTDWKNDEYLGAAQTTEEATTQRLKEGLATVISTQGVAADASGQLVGDREKVGNWLSPLCVFA